MRQAIASDEDEPRAQSVICSSCSKLRTYDQVVHRVKAGVGCEHRSMSVRRRAVFLSSFDPPDVAVPKADAVERIGDVCVC